MRYKFSLSPRVRGMIEWDLEHYHENKRNLEQYKNDIIPSTTAKYTAGIKSPEIAGATDPTFIRAYGDARPTENVAMKIATSPYVMHTERSIGAVDKALRSCDAVTLKLIDLVYWKQTHSVEGAAQIAGLTKTPAYDRLNNILCIIGLEMGYVTI